MTTVFSRRTSYAIRVLRRLAESPATSQGHRAVSLARAEGVPVKYLEHALQDLRRAGVVESKPGPGGGYRLARPADQITIGEVVRALEGDVAPARCVEEGVVQADCPSCPGLSVCSLREVWLDLKLATLKVLDSVTLQHLVWRQRQLLARAAESYAI